MDFDLRMPRPGAYERKDVIYVVMLLDCLIKIDNPVQSVECSGNRIASNNRWLEEFLAKLRQAHLFDQLIRQLQTTLHVDVTKRESDRFTMGALRARIGNINYCFILKELKKPPDFIWEFTRE